MVNLHTLCFLVSTLMIIINFSMYLISFSDLHAWTDSLRLHGGAGQV